MIIAKYFAYFIKEIETVLLCLYSLMRTLGEVGRTLKRLYKPLAFGLGRTKHLSRSPKLLLMFGSGYINTAKQYYFIKKVRFSTSLE